MILTERWSYLENLNLKYSGIEKDTRIEMDQFYCDLQFVDDIKCFDCPTHLFSTGIIL
jgi:hypothetical protein